MDAVVDAKPVKVLYKDAEGINTFCINKVKSVSSNVTKCNFCPCIALSSSYDKEASNVHYDKTLHRSV